ncbi:hypothetical protein ACFV5G_06725 [Streptomyces sp. NPDC059766]|uniref:hypothetical protein n=1 Tax=Streptomyces sp. NPDC059766 TaxID=3346940 RepID=UPI003647A6A8
MPTQTPAAVQAPDAPQDTAAEQAPATAQTAAPTQRTAPAPGAAPAAGRSAPRSVPGSAPQSPSRLSAVPSPEPAWGEPRRPGPVRGRSHDDVGWVKAHGGAGVTSLVEVLGGTDVGARWPDPARGEPRRIVLVGRTSARGLRSVSQALGALKDGRAPQGLDLLAVVLVADAPGRLPLGLLRRIRVLRSAVPVRRVPWIPAWRTGATPKVLPRQLDRLAELVGGARHGEGAVS